ncbi:MAG: phage integrase N-terminal SAM-like domain-containing protein [Methylococcaceae bacterium]|nr:phage integrase N-terminal SAM-like domain-containing protein [Methylococcaceae bacterium]
MTSSEANFKQNYQTHLKHLKLKGLQPKTIEAYARAIRRIGVYFDHQINDLSEPQLTDYFSDLLESHSWSSVKLDLYGLKFFYTYVLNKPWTDNCSPSFICSGHTSIRAPLSRPMKPGCRC